MIDPTNSWFEIKEVQNREARTVASVVEHSWLTRYPWPTIVVFDSTEISPKWSPRIMAYNGKE
jgi:hypothetical protein